MRRSLAKLFRGEVVANDGAALHDEFDGFKGAHVGKRIAADSNEVGIVACFECANFVGPAQEIRGIDGGGLYGVERLHAPFDHLAKLSRVVTVRVDTGIRAKSHLRARLKGMAKIFTLEAADFLFLFDGLGKHARFRAFLQNVVVVVDVEDEKSPMLLGEGNTFVVDQAGMFDGVDAGADASLMDCVPCACAATLRPSLWGFFGDGLHFFERVLRRAGLIALTEHAAEAQILMTSAPYFTVSRTLRERCPRAVGDTFGLVMILKAKDYGRNAHQ